MSKSNPRHDSAAALAFSIALFCAAGVVGISIFQFALGSEPEDTRYTLAVRAAVSWLGLVPLGLLCVGLALLGAIGVMRGGFAPTRGAIGSSAIALGLALLFGALVQGWGGAVGDALPNLGGLGGRLGAALLGLLVVFASAWITWIAPARSDARVRQVDRGIAAALSHQDEHDAGVSAAEAEALYPITPLAGRGPAAPAASAQRAAQPAVTPLPVVAAPRASQAAAEPVASPAVRPLERVSPIAAAAAGTSAPSAPAASASHGSVSAARAADSPGAFAGAPAPRSSIPAGARALEAPPTPRSFEAPLTRAIPEGAKPLGRPTSALSATGGATELEDEVGPALPFEPSWERRAAAAAPTVVPAPEPELESAPIAEPSWSRAEHSATTLARELEPTADSEESQESDTVDERAAIERAPTGSLARTPRTLEPQDEDAADATEDDSEEDEDSQDPDEGTEFARDEQELGAEDEELEPRVTDEVELDEEQEEPAVADASGERAAELQASLFEAPEEPAVCADELAQRAQDDAPAAASSHEQSAPEAATSAAPSATEATAEAAPSKRAQRRAAKAREAVARGSQAQPSEAAAGAGEDYTLQPQPTHAEGRAQPVSEREQLVFDAGCLILEHGRVAVSLLQRSFQLDFKQATELLDELQQRGLIGPYVGGMRRDILLERADWLARSAR